MRSPLVLTLLTVANVLVLGSLLVAGKPAADDSAPAVLRAQAIELVDAQGQVRGQLFLGDDGGGNIRLRAGNGEVRVKIGATVDGGGLMFADKQTEPAVLLRAGGQQGPNLTLTSPDKKARVVAP
jgi:hypothetical protein